MTKKETIEVIERLKVKKIKGFTYKRHGKVRFGRSDHLVFGIAIKKKKIRYMELESIVDPKSEIGIVVDRSSHEFISDKQKEKHEVTICFY